MIEEKISTWPFYSEEEVLKVSEVLKSGKVNSWTGSETKTFEKEFAKATKSEFAIAVSNGTVALDLALKAIDIGPGDEVIVTSRTFLATVSSIVCAGAVPIFADVDVNSQNVTAESIGPKLSERTKAIVCVHLAGQACDMDPILKMAQRLGLFIIEDCAQAHGATYKGAPVGSLGHIGCWSFCQDKIISTGGEGGMVTTNDKDLWRAMWSYKDHGKCYDLVHRTDHLPGFRWLHSTFGTNWRMTEMQAAIGRIQLRNLSQWISRRQENANEIISMAEKNKFLRVPKPKCSLLNDGELDRKQKDALAKIHIISVTFL